MKKEEIIEGLERIICKQWGLVYGSKEHKENCIDIHGLATALEASIGLDEKAMIEEFGMYFQENSETDIGNESVQIDLADLLATNPEVITIKENT